MADQLENTIRENAQGPAEAHGDSGGMRQHRLKDQTRSRESDSLKSCRLSFFGECPISMPVSESVSPVFTRQISRFSA